MISLIVGLLVCVAIAAVIVGLVAIPARREGRELLTARGEDFVGTFRDGVSTVVDKITPGSSDASDTAAADTTDADLQAAVKDAKATARADAKAAAATKAEAKANPTQSV